MTRVLAILAGLFGGVLAFGAKEETWVKVESSHFTVLTPAGTATARAWALELEQFRRALQAMVSVPEERLRPVTVVLFRNDRTFRPFKPLEKGKPQNIGGVFTKIGDSHVLALALDSEPEVVRRVIFHEAVHWYSAATEHALPPWLEEGVAEVYSTFKTDAANARCSFGAAIRSHLLVLRQRGFDVRRVMHTPRGSLEYNEGNRASEFYARSWILVHYLLFGANSPGRDGVVRYLEALASEADPETAFRRGFGKSYEEFRGAIEDYLKNGRYRLQHVSVPVEDIAARLRIGPAAPGDVDQALGVLLAVSRPEDPRPARVRLESALAQNPRHAGAWQALGELALAEQDDAEAARCFGEAIKFGSRSFYAHYALGSTRLHGEDRFNGLGNPNEAERAAEDFRRAIALNPRFLPAYESLAGLVFSAEKYDPADRARFERARQLDRENVWLDLGLASCDFRENRRESARRRLDLILATPSAPSAVRGYAASLLRADDWDEFNREIDGLFRSMRFREAAERLAAARTRFPDRRVQATLELNHRRAAGLARLNEAIDLANQQRYSEARVILQEVITGDFDAAQKTDARRVLTQIEGR